MSSILTKILIFSGHSIFGLIGYIHAQLQYVVHVSQLEGSSESILAPQIEAISLEFSPVTYNVTKKYGRVLFNTSKRIHFGTYITGFSCVTSSLESNTTPVHSKKIATPSME